MRELGIDLPIIFFPVTVTLTWRCAPSNSGAVDFLQKPVDDQRLLTAIGSAV